MSDERLAAAVERLTTKVDELAGLVETLETRISAGLGMLGHDDTAEAIQALPKQIEALVDRLDADAEAD